MHHFTLRRVARALLATAVICLSQGAESLGAGTRRAGRLLLLTACMAVGVAGIGAVEAHAATPSLAGETFSSPTTGGSVSGTCPNPGKGNLSFSANGRADGPYPGTFNEIGSFSLTGGSLSAFSSTFTVRNTAGTVTVTGSKSLTIGTMASCVVNPDGTIDLELGTGMGTIDATYTATIDGTFPDTGTTRVQLTAFEGDLSLVENFNSPSPTPIPSSIAQCTNRGWLDFGTLFKNQGDCVSFVTTRGKNPPSGS
jgi:hypothetical protein